MDKKNFPESEKKSSFLSRKRDYLLPASILIAAVLIAGSLIYNAGRNSTPTPSVKEEKSAAVVAPSEIGDSPILGDSQAPVTVIEYGDYQCPFCGAFFKETEPLLIKNYVNQGKVKFVYKDFAFLDQFPGGKNESHLAAEAAWCANDQNKFWPYHDLIFKTELEDQQVNLGKSENNGNLTVTKLESLAKELNLNESQFNNCLETGKYKDKVLQEFQAAQARGVNATPTLFINGQKFESALPFNQLKIIIDSLLK